jgi:hypothetical protein
MKLTIRSNACWTFLKMWDQMKTTSFHGSSHFVRANKIKVGGYTVLFVAKWWKKILNFLETLFFSVNSNNFATNLKNCQTWKPQNFNYLLENPLLGFLKLQVLQLHDQLSRWDWGQVWHELQTPGWLCGSMIWPPWLLTMVVGLVVSSSLFC